MGAWNSMAFELSEPITKYYIYSTTKETHRSLFGTILENN